MSIQKWWGYLHTSGTIQAKRYFSEEDISEALESPFVKQIVHPFNADGREKALEYIKSQVKPKNSMEPLTIEKLKELPQGIFATGEIENSPEGVYMTNWDIGRKLRWVATRGMTHDWAIYIWWNNETAEWVYDHGDKVRDENHIKKLVPCTDEAFKMYRY